MDVDILKLKEAGRLITEILVMGLFISIVPSVLAWKRSAAGDDVLVSALFSSKGYAQPAVLDVVFLLLAWKRI